MPETSLGFHFLQRLPGVDISSVALPYFEQLDAALQAGDTCIAVDDDTVSDALLCSGLVGTADARLPFILEDGLLSSRRYWRYEQALAEICLERSADRSPLLALQRDASFAEDFVAIFPAVPEAIVDGHDWQRLAALVALAHKLSIITGGPGTGKTTVAGRIIALAMRAMQRQQQRDLNVCIAAPTGKAAQRLRESLMETGQALHEQGFLSTLQLQHLTAQAATLHRLLRQRNKEQIDLVIIDEISMADVATLSCVMQGLAAHTQVIFLGDPKQLASVEAGHVLGEIAALDQAQVFADVANFYQELCGVAADALQATATNPLALAQIHLRKNWRSAKSPALSELAAAIENSPAAVQTFFEHDAYQASAAQAVEKNGRRIPVFAERRDMRQQAEMFDALMTENGAWLQAVVSASDPQFALDILAQRRFLCARRSGIAGVEWLNQRIEEYLRQESAIQVWDNGHYHGQPVMVTENNYDLDVYNGDIGIVHGERHQASVYFPDSDGRLRSINVERLAHIEAVFAMSIHKSQGSQFEHVEILTAQHDEGHLQELLTKELIYTAITRAAYSARLWMDWPLLQAALQRHSSRRTGFGRFIQRII